MEGEEGVILKMSDLQRCMFDRLRGCGVFPSNFLESSLLYQDVFLAVKHYRCSRLVQTETITDRTAPFYKTD